MTVTKPPAPHKPPPANQEARDAIVLLTADHEAVSGPSAGYEKSRSASRRKSLAAEICTALGVPAQIEEGIVYPTVKTALRDEVRVPEATVEHAGARNLIAQMDGVEPHGETDDPRVKVLSDFVKHPVQEEQNEMFPKAKASSLDLVERGTRRAARRGGLPAQAA